MKEEVDQGHNYRPPPPRRPRNAGERRVKGPFAAGKKIALALTRHGGGGPYMVFPAGGTEFEVMPLCHILLRQLSDASLPSHLQRNGENK